MRRPAVAGRFYAGDREGLLAEIEGCYAGVHGPGRLPRPGRRGDLAGLVVPHAGYMYSGPVAAHAFLALAESGVPETVVIVGPNHTGYGMPLAVATEDFETPLGVASVDRELTEDLIQGILEADMEAHRYEHSIEVMVPFLQHLDPRVKVAAVCMGRQDWEAARAVGEVLAQALAGRDALLLASTDFSHYVPQAVARSKDRLALERIVAGDAGGLLRTVEREGVTMCGYGPVAAALVALGGPRGELLKYATSGDVVPMEDVVGYASVALRT